LNQLKNKLMDNKAIYHNWEIIEYFEMCSDYNQECLLRDGEYEAIGMLDCGEIIDVYEIEKIEL